MRRYPEPTTNRGIEPMGLLFYTTVRNGIGLELHRSLTQVVPREAIEAFSDLESFSRRLSLLPSCMNIVVLLAGTREDLTQLRSIKHLLEDTRVLLVLPDGSTETVRMAHELTPRFLTYLDGDFEDLSAVLKKMLGNQ